MEQEFWLLRFPSSVYGNPETDEFDSSMIRESILEVEFTSKRFRDFEWAEYRHCLVNERTANILADEGFTGYILKPVISRMKIIKKGYDSRYDDEDNPGFHPKQVENIKIPKYWELSVTGWGGVALPSSGISRIPGTDEWTENNYKWEKAIDKKQWDGSDFFFIWPYPLFIMITDRVAKAISKNKLKGSRVISLPDYTKEEESSFVKGASPGRLHQYLPEDRARKYGEPFDIY